MKSPTWLTRSAASLALSAANCTLRATRRTSSRDLQGSGVLSAACRACWAVPSAASASCLAWAALWTASSACRRAGWQTDGLIESPAGGPGVPFLQAEVEAQTAACSNFCSVMGSALHCCACVHCR